MSPYLRSVEGDPAEPRPGEGIAITVDGEPLKALPGQSVAAALMAGGRDSWRTTRDGGRARGVFCGIGACFDCLVVVNGLPDVRACQRVVRAGDEVTTQRGAELPAGACGEGPAAEAGVRVVPVVVVGAGPAGMSAAVAAADAGKAVLLVDAAERVGGQFNRQLPEEFRAGRPEKLQHDWKAFARLRDRIATDPKITHLTGTSVWALERPSASGEVLTRLWLQTGAADAAGRRVSAVETPALVLATGAYDRVLPFPGWDLPGVYSAGAAQALAKGQRISVGQRVVVAGTGPFLLPVAESLVGVGAEVVALLEANHPMTVAKGMLSDPLAGLGKLSEAANYARLLARHRIPLRHGRTVVAAHGTDRVEAVTIARLDRDWKPIPGTQERIEVDAVCVGFGFTANLELAISARCTLTEGPDGGPAVQVDEHQQTTIPGIYAAGELTGIGGAALAAAEGWLAGTTAASSPSATSAVDVEGRRSPAQTDEASAASSPSATSVGRRRGGRALAGRGWLASVVAGRRLEGAAGSASSPSATSATSADGGGGRRRPAKGDRAMGEAAGQPTAGAAASVSSPSATSADGEGRWSLAQGDRAASGVAEHPTAGAPARASSPSATSGAGGASSPSATSLSAVRSTAVERAQRVVAKGKRFADVLAAAYPVREGWVGWSDGGTVVCRCEGVSKGEVEETVGARDVGGSRSLKLACRAGLGMCQGRVCGRTVAAISGVRSEYGRPVAQPVRLMDLAAAEILEDL